MTWTTDGGQTTVGRKLTDDHRPLIVDRGAHVSGCGRTGEHDPHPFTTTRGSFPPEPHEEQCPGIPKKEETK